jgi:hypothetical protein
MMVTTITGRASRPDGFSLLETVVALGLLLVVIGAVFGVLSRSQSLLQTQPEAAAMQQRLRAAVDALFRDIVSAERVLPYRFGGASEDPPGTFRSDTITVVHSPVAGGPRVARTYFWKSDEQARSYQLVQADGGGGDEPVADDVVGLAFSYFGGPAGEPCRPAGAMPGMVAALAPDAFGDGPWCPAEDGGSPFDADLLRIRLVQVVLRVHAAIDSLRGPMGAMFRWAGTAPSGAHLVPDVVVQFKVAPRHLNLGP